MPAVIVSRDEDAPGIPAEDLRDEAAVFLLAEGIGLAREDMDGGTACERGRRRGGRGV